jgi:predicted PurR-regulated permease PerM
MISEQEFTRRMVRTVLTIGAVAILLAALWAAREALIVIYVSALIAMGFSPLVRLIERPRVHDRRVPRVFAILSIYLAVMGLIVLLGLIVLPPLVEQATTLWDRMPQHLNAFQRILIRYRLMTRPVTLQEAVQNAPAGSGGNAVATVFFALTGVMGGLLGLITIVILSFYFLIEGESLMRYATSFLPQRQRPQVVVAAAAAVSKVSAWLRAQLILAGMMGTVSAIGLGYLGVPYFYVLALVAAVGETIPIVGPIIAGTAAVGIALSVSIQLAVTVGVFFFFLHQLEANVLVPKIMEQRVGVSPAAVLIALLVGGSILGVVGAILAIPTAAILSVMIGEFSGINSHAREVEIDGGVR